MNPYTHTKSESDYKFFQNPNDLELVDSEE